ncbi:Metallophosphoesteras-like protein [Mycena venus]|uniref:Metallophosphoesteras-like protein n=1 Tax=Mycena venus TaxID=2733690 RepID=A0A8H6XD88_9AGAR|nr:Metallophosphoesteras-like protein [Mycena venus]
MLYAISDLHLSFQSNRDEWQKLKPHPEDGLILCGDIGEKAEHLDLAFGIAKQNFKEVFWCPGNHELYSLPIATSQRGEAKYAECRAVAARHGVHTPEDTFVRWEDESGGPVLVAPIFTLYDYTFRPAHLTSTEHALAWAEEANTVATDEAILFPDPHRSREAWCAALVEKAEAKLAAAAVAAGDVPLVIVNHWPLREDLVFIPRIPRFILWCGTKRTEDWHVRFNACVVVSGHLHVPRTDWKDGVRFEECSLGYPREWADVRQSGRDINDLLRVIWPGPPPPATGTVATQWRRWG